MADIYIFQFYFTVWVWENGKVLTFIKNVILKVANDKEYVQKVSKKRFPRHFDACLKPLYNKKKKVESVLLKKQPLGYNRALKLK